MPEKEALQQRKTSMIRPMTNEEFVELRASGLNFAPQAVVNQPPAYFMNNFGVVFAEDCDDLDNFIFANFWLDDDKGSSPFAFQQYAGNHPDTVNIYLPISFALLEIPNIVESILWEFDLSVERDLEWVRNEDEALFA